MEGGREGRWEGDREREREGGREGGREGAPLSRTGTSMGSCWPAILWRMSLTSTLCLDAGGGGTRYAIYSRGTHRQ